MIKEKEKNYSVQELTRREISRLNADEKANKFKKDNNRYKKVIANYKENEKKLTKRILMLEQKLEFLKENSIGSLFSLSENIADIKASFVEYCNEFSDDVQIETLKSFSKEFDYISDFIINVCDTIEHNSIITSQDEKLFKISNNELKKFNLDSDNDFNIDDADFQWDFNNSVKQNVEENQFAADKIKKIFYETPANNDEITNKNNVSVGLTKNYNGLFDFNEALNPTMSLNDIMADLMSDSDKNSNSNMLSSSEMGTTTDLGNQSEYDAWFMSLQNMISKETNKDK